VDHGYTPRHTVKPGTHVHVLFYEDARPHLLNATVGTLTPMELRTSDPSVEMLKPSMRSILVTEDSGTVAKAECTVLGCHTEAEGWKLEVDVTAWEEVDRRRYARHRIEIPIQMRLVKEARFGPEISDLVAVTKDVSLGGMLIECGQEIAQGSLVEVRATLQSREHIRVLAVVVRADGEPNQYGIEFLDFVGGSRYIMHSFLSEAA
jgi:hypothetical protein